MAAFGKAVPGSLAPAPAASQGMDSNTSMSQGTAVGSGSRPGTGSTKTMSSAPADIRTMGRDVPGWLK